MSEESSRIYSFGPFKLDPGERILLLRDEPVPITPKAFDTLSVLLEHAGHIVTKDDLLKAVWPNVVVEEATLAQNVATIRRILTEGASARDFIETVPKHGYRFVGPVVSEIAPGVAAGSDVRVELQEAREEPELRSEKEQPSPRARSVLWIVPAVLLAALVAATGWWLLRPARESNPVLIAVPFCRRQGDHCLVRARIPRA